MFVTSIPLNLNDIHYIILRSFFNLYTLVVLTTAQVAVWQSKSFRPFSTSCPEGDIDIFCSICLTTLKEQQHIGICGFSH